MAKEGRKYEKPVFFAALIVAILGLSGGGYVYYGIAEGIIKNTEALEGEILELRDENIALTETLQMEQQKNNMFEDKIGQLAGTVGTLDKLAKTDKELLQKYSKVYFLNENYTPKGLMEIPKEYLSDQSKTIRILASTSPYLLDMIGDAKRDGVNLLIISGFRSFGEQSSLKGSYLFTYGSGANKFSADQGYSEHQLGTTVDFTSADLGAGFSNFGKSAEYKWLLENAYKYGFILSYPEGNSYYQYEPWHWRFVGRQLSRRLHDENQNYYDLGQRQIDSYLISFFD